jgi:hypothetical protein
VVAARAALAYLALAIALTWPLARHLGTHVAHDLGDPLLVTYLLNWNATVTPLTEAWWHPPFFWPARDVMTLSEHFIGLWPVAAPLRWLSLSPVAVYNVLFIASFWASGVAGWWLGRVLVRDELAAFVAGLVYMFAPYRAEHLGHLQVLLSAGIPLVFAALHRAVATVGAHRWRWPAIAIACWALQGLITGYYLLFVPVGVVIWLLWFAPRDRALWLRLASFGLLASALMAPLLWRYATAHEAGGYSRGFGEVVVFAAEVEGVVQASKFLAVWGGVLSQGHEENMFPGAAVLVLVAVACATIPRAREPVARGTMMLIAAAALLACVAAFGFAYPGERTIGGLRISLTNPHKQLGLAWSALVIAALSAHTVRKAWRQQSPAAGYLVLAVAMWIFALGPMPHAAGTPIWYAAPYRFLFSYIPGFDEVRVPARFWMIACVALAALAAIGVARLRTRMPRGAAVAAALAVVVVAEGWLARLPMPPAPAGVDIPAAANVVLEVPAGDAARDATAMYRSVLHGRPVLNGWSGYEPPHYRPLVGRLKAFDTTVLADLARVHGPLALVVDTKGDWHERYVAMARALGASCAPQDQYVVCLIVR